MFGNKKKYLAVRKRLDTLANMCSQSAREMTEKANNSKNQHKATEAYAEAAVFSGKEVGFLMAISILDAEFE